MGWPGPRVDTPAWVPQQAGFQVENVVGADWWTGVGCAGVAWGLVAAGETKAGLLPGWQPAAGFLRAQVETAVAQPQCRQWAAGVCGQ